MSAPPQAVAALVWAIAGPPLLVYAATRVRAGRLSLHAGLMLASVGIELAVFTAFMFFMTPGPRRDLLTDLPFYKIHLTFAIAAFAGMAWQITSRAVVRLAALSPADRPVHRAGVVPRPAHRDLQLRLHLRDAQQMKISPAILSSPAVPLVCGVVVSYGFAQALGSCSALVGPLFASKCHGRQLNTRSFFQTAGTALGTLIAAFLGAWLESRRRFVPPEASTQGDL